MCAADDLAVSGLESDDIAYLDAGLETFLSAVGRPELYAVLSDWSEWRKIYPLTLGGHSPGTDPMPMKAFRAKEWIQGGIFRMQYGYGAECQDHRLPDR